MYYKWKSYDIWFLRYGAQRIFCYFGQFLALLPPSPPLSLATQKIKILKKWKLNTWRWYNFTHAYHKWQSYDVWFLRHEAPQTSFFVILDHSLAIYPHNHPKNQYLEKIKKTPGDIIILQNCATNHDHVMLHCSWDTKRINVIFIFHLGYFLPSAASRCILVPFEQYGQPKKCTPKHSCNTFSIYISHKN